MKDYVPSDLVQAANDANLAAEEAIEALYDMEIYKENAKDILAKIMCSFRAGNDGKISEAELERRARASEDWVTFREEQFKAIKVGMAAKVKMQNTKLYFDAIQSALSFRKMEMSRLGD